MVRYIGHYSAEEEREESEDQVEDTSEENKCNIARTYNILLEYGEKDLDEYFADDRSLPPVRSEEIIRFWQSLFKIAEALKIVHSLPFERDDGGVVERYDG
jgi:hypothetical protein